jgi:hypothetical protein
LAATTVVGRSRNAIRFEGCFRPQRLLTTGRDDFQCPLDDIVVVHTYWCRRYRLLKLVTVHGVALVAEQSAVGFAELQDALSGFSRPNRPGYALEHPRLNGPLGLACFVGAWGGVFAGLILTQRVASTGTVVMALLGGGFCDLVGTHSLIQAVCRWWSRRSRR